MKIFIKNPSKGDKTVEVEVSANATVDDLLEKGSNLLGYNKAEMRLVFVNRTLESGKKLSDYNINDLSTVWILVRAHGG